MKEAWELARYIIDAKKCIDSLIYIRDNLKSLNINVRSRIENHLRQFYINCRVVLEKTYPNKKEKKEIREKDKIINSIFYEADKKYAHKDSNYVPKKYNSMDERIDDLKVKLKQVTIICKKMLPEGLTLDYVPHDKELYRLVNGIDYNKEERIKEMLFPLYNKNIGPLGDKVYEVYHDTEDNIDKPPIEYGVVLEEGLNIYEGLQNRQDWCIKCNVLFDLNMWCSL